MLKKIMRLALTPLLVLGLTFSGFGMAFAAPEGELSDLQIRETLNEIIDRYEVGEVFSEEDANFVKKYVGSPTESVQPMAEGGHETFSGSLGSTEGFGYIKYTMSNKMTYFDGFINVQTKDFSVRDLGYEAKITAFGIVGSGGIGKVYDRTWSQNAKTNYIGQNFSDSFESIGTILSFNYRGLVDGSSFNLYPE